MKRADPFNMEILMLHLSGLSWVDSCRVAGVRIGMGLADAQKLADTLEEDDRTRAGLFTHTTPEAYRALANGSRRRGDAVMPDTPQNRYSIGACEVWAMALDRIADGGAEPWELFQAFRRQKQIERLYGVTL